LTPDQQRILESVMSEELVRQGYSIEAPLPENIHSYSLTASSGQCSDPGSRSRYGAKC
jgi:hypothetical protein